MANRRMFSNQIINSARFLQMPATTRLLYYDLGMKADDEGFVEAFSVMRMTCASEDDLRLLDAKGYIRILNDDLVVYILDWKINNQIRKDRFQESIYHNLKSKLADTGCHSIVKYSIEKNSIDKYSTVHARQPENFADSELVPFPGAQIGEIVKREQPLFDEVISYAESRGRVDLAKTFYDYYNENNWIDSAGVKVRSWKQKFISWEQRNPKPTPSLQQPYQEHNPLYATIENTIEGPQLW